MFGLKKMFRKWNVSLRKGSAEHYSERDTPVSPGPKVFDTGLIDASMSGWLKQETDELIEGFKILSEDVVLDVGCGDSPFLLFCAMRGAEVIFADIDAQKIAAMTKILENTPARAVTPLVCDACALPLKDASASKIIAMEVMEHVDDASLFMKELVRVGKPGAQYLITMPDPVAENLQKHLAAPSYFEKPNHIRVIGREEFERLIVDAGLIVEQRKYYGFYWAIWWIFFWSCKQDLHPPWHPLLVSWTETWQRLLETQEGQKVKKVLDDFMPKSQAIIARKPHEPIHGKRKGSSDG
jgi:ubiquinone/menaquinone biosynthesis C-methylase UbiE